jgi:hypothetical protein
LTVRFVRQFFNPQDPYVQVTLLANEATARTLYMEAGGTDPVWDETHENHLTLEIPDDILNDGTLACKFEAWNENTALDDIIGTAELVLSAEDLQLSGGSGQSKEIPLDTGGALTIDIWCTKYDAPAKPAGAGEEVVEEEEEGIFSDVASAMRRVSETMSLGLDLDRAQQESTEAKVEEAAENTIEQTAQVEDTAAKEAEAKRLAEVQQASKEAAEAAAVEKAARESKATEEKQAEEQLAQQAEEQLAQQAAAAQAAQDAEAAKNEAEAEAKAAQAQVEENEAKARQEAEQQAQQAAQADAATKLQALQRGKARKESLMVKKEAATKLQSLYRGAAEDLRQVEREQEEQQVMGSLALRLQSLQRGKARKESLMVKKGAVAKLQSLYRGTSTRSDQAKVRDERARAAAAQAIRRGELEREAAATQAKDFAKAVQRRGIDVAVEAVEAQKQAKVQAAAVRKMEAMWAKESEVLAEQPQNDTPSPLHSDSPRDIKASVNPYVHGGSVVELEAPPSAAPLRKKSVNVLFQQKAAQDVASLEALKQQVAADVEADEEAEAVQAEAEAQEKTEAPWEAEMQVQQTRKKSAVQLFSFGREKHANARILAKKVWAEVGESATNTVAVMGANLRKFEQAEEAREEAQLAAAFAQVQGLPKEGNPLLEAALRKKSVSTLFVAKKAEGVEALEQLKVEVKEEAQTAQNNEVEMAAEEAKVRT